MHRDTPREGLLRGRNGDAPRAGRRHAPGRTRRAYGGEAPEHCAINEALPAFAAAWQREGFDPRLDFIAEAARTRGASRKLPTELAERCLALAADIFSVHFTRLEQGPEGEHGRSRPIPVNPVRLAAVYVSPSRVAGLSRAKAIGRLSATDGVSPERKEGGWDFYGVDEEVALQVARLVGMHPKEPGEGAQEEWEAG